jgi:hypothetical protein
MSSVSSAVATVGASPFAVSPLEAICLANMALSSLRFGLVFSFDSGLVSLFRSTGQDRLESCVLTFMRRVLVQLIATEGGGKEHLASCKQGS